MLAIGFNFKKIIILFFTLGVFFISFPANASYSQKPQVQHFIQEMVTKHQFDRKKLNAIFDEVKPNQKIINMMTAPHEGLPWYRYRALFVKPERARLGSAFWKEHSPVLSNAQEYYGVPAPIILAILGVETDYGRVLGNYRVIDALSTLAFHYPPRAAYFKGELEQFLLLTRENSLDPLAVKGSYAGAIGQPQFMPSSYRQYAVDTKTKGYSDLMHNNSDVIFSVANYFKAHGWQNSQPVAMQANVSGRKFYPFLNRLKDKWTIAQLKQYGVYPAHEISDQQQASLIYLEGANGPEYWLVFHNFDVIMRYNTSAHYAMAVKQLGDLITQDHDNNV